MRRMLSRSALVVVGAGALSIGTVIGVLTSDPSLGPAPTPAAGTDLGGAPAYDSGARTVSTTGRWSGAIDRSRKAVVNKAYWSQYATNYSVPIRWSGAVSGCKAGSTSSRSRAATRESLNFVRSLAGLEPVRFADTMSSASQKAALLMAANKSLSHDPPSSWKCFTKTGATTAGRSNLALAYPNLTSGQIVDLYMKDGGSSNVAVGHRRWLLNPWAKTLGSGSTTSANALYVVGSPDTTNANPKYVPWPTPGFFPAPMEPDKRWSISAGSYQTDFHSATVSVTTASGRKVGTTKWSVIDGYAQPTLVWQMAEAQPGTTYKVHIRGIKTIGSSRTSRMSYSVKLFKPAR